MWTVPKDVWLLSSWVASMSMSFTSDFSLPLSFLSLPLSLSHFLYVFRLSCHHIRWWHFLSSSFLFTGCLWSILIYSATAISLLSLFLSFAYVLFFFAGDAKMKIHISLSWPRMIVCLCMLSLSISFPSIPARREYIYINMHTKSDEEEQEEEGSLFSYFHTHWWWKHLTNFFTQFYSSSSFACRARSNASHHFLSLHFFSHAFKFEKKAI